MKKISKLSLNQSDFIKKPDMKWFKGGKGYLYCTVDFGGYTMTGYCGPASNQLDCCIDIWNHHGGYLCCSCS